MKKLFTLLLVAAVSVTTFAQKQELTFQRMENAKEIQFPVNRDDGTWITWDKDNWNGNSIGTNGPAKFMVGSRWEPADLEDYEGWYINAISFIPAEAAADYRLRIWSGADFNFDEVYDQEIPWQSIKIGEFTVINLTTPYKIETEGVFDILFGYHIDTPQGYPAGCDEGPAVTGKGDLIRFDAPGEEWENIASMGLNYNWVLRALVSETPAVGVETLGGYQVNAYPNPFTNEITFSGDVEQVVIYNLIGQEVMNVRVSGSSVSTSDLANGVYMVTFQNQYGERAVRKMIKQ